MPFQKSWRSRKPNPKKPNFKKPNLKKPNFKKPNFKKPNFKKPNFVDISKVIDKDEERSLMNKPVTRAFSSSVGVSSVLNSILPKRMYCKLKYADDTYEYTGTSGWTRRQFTVNGLYDPDISGAGHQPRGFDQLMDIYDAYIVMASKIRLVIANSSTTPAIVAVMPTSSSGEIIHAYDVYERDKMRYLNLSANDAGGSTNILTHYITVKNLVGLRRLSEADDQYVGDSANNPEVIPKWSIMSRSIDAASAYAVRIQTVITYYCVFFSRGETDAS